MKRGAVLWSLFLVGCMGCIALATGFNWIGGSSGEWDEPTDWSTTVPDPDGWPNEGDDYTITQNAHIVIVLNDDVSMDDLTVGPSTEHSVTLSGAYTLTCETITISGPSTGSTNDFNTFASADSAEIRTADPD